MRRAAGLYFGMAVLLVALAIIARVSQAQESPKPSKEPAGRVLFIGIDGCRFDALEAAEAPNLDRLCAAGCYSTPPGFSASVIVRAIP